MVFHIFAFCKKRYHLIHISHANAQTNRSYHSSVTVYLVLLGYQKSWWHQFDVFNRWRSFLKILRQINSQCFTPPYNPCVSVWTFFSKQVQCLYSVQNTKNYFHHCEAFIDQHDLHISLNTVTPKSKDKSCCTNPGLWVLLTSHTMPFVIHDRPDCQPEFEISVVHP